MVAREILDLGRRSGDEETRDQTRVLFLREGRKTYKQSSRAVGGGRSYVPSLDEDDESALSQAPACLLHDLNQRPSTLERRQEFPSMDEVDRAVGKRKVRGALLVMGDGWGKVRRRGENVCRSASLSSDWERANRAPLKSISPSA